MTQYATVGECAAACSSNSTCTAFAYFYPNAIDVRPAGTCYLKNACATIVPANPSNNIYIKGAKGWPAMPIDRSIID